MSKNDKSNSGSANRPASRFKIKLTEQKGVVDKINLWVEDNGYAKGMHGFCDHKSGLPKLPNVLVRPTYCDHSGSRTIMIAPTELHVADISKPYHENIWSVTSTVPYSSMENLREQLDPLVFSDLGIWLSQD